MLGAILCVVGIYNLGVYFSHGPEIGLVNYNFAKGLIALAVGVIIIVKPDLLAAVVPVVFGCALIVGGIVKLQIALDLFRMKHKFWYLPCIAAALIIAAGVVIVSNPFTAFLTLMIFIGVSLIAESVFDAAALIFIKRLQKRMLG